MNTLESVYEKYDVIHEFVEIELECKEKSWVKLSSVCVDGA